MNTSTNNHFILCPHCKTKYALVPMNSDTTHYCVSCTKHLTAEAEELHALESAAIADLTSIRAGVSTYADYTYAELYRMLYLGTPEEYDAIRDELWPSNYDEMLDNYLELCN